jgi:hypothetical protein
VVVVIDPKPQHFLLLIFQILVEHLLDEVLFERLPKTFDLTICLGTAGLGVYVFNLHFLQQTLERMILPVPG